MLKGVLIIKVGQWSCLSWQLLLKPDSHGSNLVIGKFYFLTTVLRRRKHGT